MGVFEKIKRVWNNVCGDVNVITDHQVNPDGTVTLTLPKCVRLNSDPTLDWLIQGELGDGNFGKVFQAEHKSNGQMAAAKMCRLDEEHELEAFRIELKIISSLNHESIIAFIDAYSFEGKLWLILEYCDGGALNHIIEVVKHPLSEPQIAHIALKMAEALKHLHSKMIIHRDLKAGNILVTSTGNVKLADFGVSALNTFATQRRTSFIGTPYWMAPEIVMCEVDRRYAYDYKVDVWALGITLIECAQMKPPHHERDPNRVTVKIKLANAPRLDRPRCYSRFFNQFIEKCLIKEPDRRLSAEQLLEQPFLSNAEDSQSMCELVQECQRKTEEDSKTPSQFESILKTAMLPIMTNTLEEEEDSTNTVEEEDSTNTVEEEDSTNTVEEEDSSAESALEATSAESTLEATSE